MKHIIKLTIKEVINKQIIKLGIVLTLIYLLIYGTGLYYMIKDLGVGGEQFFLRQEIGYQLMVLGWYVSTFMVGSLAIVTGAGSISQEVENGTILGMASSPLSRRSIVLGKYTAYALVSSSYSIVLLISIMTLSGYFCRLIFDPQGVVAAVVVFTLFPLALLAVTMALSAMFTTMSAGIIAFMVFVVSIIGGFVEQIGALMGNGALINIGIVSSLIMPSDAVYRLAVDLASGTMAQSSIVNFGPFGTASTPSTLMLVYTIVYLGIWLMAAVHHFEKRDL